MSESSQTMKAAQVTAPRRIEIVEASVPGTNCFLITGLEPSEAERLVEALCDHFVGDVSSIVCGAYGG